MIQPAIMLQVVNNFLGIAAYGVSAWILAARSGGATGDVRRMRTVALLIAFGGLIAHALTLTLDHAPPGMIDLSLAFVLSVTALAIVALYLGSALVQPLAHLGTVVLPIAALTVLIRWIMPRVAPLAVTTSLQVGHIALSLLAWGLLSLAALQGAFLWLRERHLREHRHPPAHSSLASLLGTLPPLDSMERSLFWMMGLGFALLTATVGTGMLFSEEIFGRPLRFNHHMMLSLASWLMFGVVLAGHWWFGWRGRPAIRAALTAFLLLILGYFGTRFVLEFLLGRT